MLDRNLYKLCFSDEFGSQMRFITGPRQCGKTTLIKSFLENNQMESLYYNWDIRETKNKYLKKSDFYLENILNVPSTIKPWVCMDEIHKYPRWKDILKEFYDRDKDKTGFIVTGSAKLDLFRKSGDSLAGRYFLFRLFPLVLNELSHINKPEKDNLETPFKFIEKRLSARKYEQGVMETLLTFSGFPDPFLSGKKMFQKKWKNSYIDKLINEDLRSISQVKEVENVARLMMLLPNRVASPLSVNSLIEDMLVSYSALKNYLNLLELSFITFLITPYNKKINRSIKKEKKLYFYDWTQAETEGARFENYIALEVMSMVEIWNDLGNEFGLYYLRTKDGKESDFLITKEKDPWLIIESKLQKQKIENHHFKSADKFGGIPVLQIVLENKIAEKYDKGFQVSASRFFA